MDPLRLVAISLVALLPAGAAAPNASAPVALAGSLWRGHASATAKGPAGALPARGLAFVLAFGPRAAAPALGSTEFLLHLSDGGAELPIRGAYALDARGRATLTPDLDALGSALATAVLESCGEQADPSGCASLASLDAVASKAKLKLSASADAAVETLALSAKLRFDWLDPASGKSAAKLSVSFRDAGDAERENEP